MFLVKVWFCLLTEVTKNMFRLWSDSPWGHDTSANETNKQSKIEAGKEERRRNVLAYVTFIMRQRGTESDMVKEAHSY